ncbi:hypothetical protein YC2023_042768 [Brassica napus]
MEPLKLLLDKSNSVDGLSLHIQWGNGPRKTFELRSNVTEYDKSETSNGFSKRLKEL